MFQQLTFLVISCLNIEGNASRILGVFPIMSLSHQMVFRTLTYELAKRGHELIVFTPIPNPEKSANVTEIDTSNIYAKLATRLKVMNGKRGAILKPDFFTTKQLVEVLLVFPKAVLKHPEFIELVKDESQKFDLIIAEAYYYFPFFLSKKYEAPLIWFSSFYGLPDNYEIMGAPARHPILHPSFYRTRIYNLSFWEKLYEVYIELRLVYQFKQIVQTEESMIRETFEDDNLSIGELRGNVDLMFANANPVFEGNRPMPPNIVCLGGLHLKPVKKLPEELQRYLDSSTRGVVYVSLGTNVRFSVMDADLVQAFADGLSDLPYDILWKFDAESLPDQPKNIRIEKWFPQRDLLFHPKIKAFVTQGGLQSADEAIDAGIPVVALPILGDQFFNAEQYERLGVGIRVAVETMTAKDLTNAVNAVIDNESYRRNMKRLGTLMRDQPQSSLERGIWWTEYVIRHKGAKHLRSLAANLTWSEHLMLDVVLVVLTVVCLFSAMLFLVVRLTVRKVLGLIVRN